MNAGEIGESAGRVFKYKAPLNWIIRSQEDQDDHGIDCEIELKDSSGKALGKESVFKIQLKGQEHCTLIENDTKVSFSVSLERLKYYLSFNIPVILVVVDVTTEDIYWVSVTDNDTIRSNVSKSSSKTLTVHLPVANKLEKNNADSFASLLSSVESCWNFLSLRDLKVAVENCTTLQPENLDKCIDQVGDALFKAYHIKLDKLFCDRDFNELYKQASDLIKSPVVPVKDRFLATLYFERAFNIEPYTKVKNQQIEEQLKLCDLLLNLARKQRESVYRLSAMAKVRSQFFGIHIEQLHAVHHTNQHFESNSFEYLFINGEAHKQYNDACVQLQKLINLCHRLIKAGQFNILADLMCDISLSIGLFKTVHSARGSESAIAFLDDWYQQIMQVVLTYVAITEDYRKIEQLYLMLNVQSELKSIIKFDARSLIIEKLPEANDLLERLDDVMKANDSSPKFYDASVEEQKRFLTDLAKNLGVDPDDKDCELGQIVARGLVNYDPTNVIGHCEHMFVDYRPGGIVAEQLHMHSAGGMHLLVCLKHGYAAGTGNILLQAFDNDKAPAFAQGFKQQHCDKCNDCMPRDGEWVWSLRWQHSERAKYSKILNKYGI
ncbi:DUF4365 domain-containing protein [Vibrio harveyi]|uniref:DUF4365 domain-containing protein n=1 Tax=Vibrio harveyi TaxID=669 RepID=UPI00390C0205